MHFSGQINAYLLGVVKTDVRGMDKLLGPDEPAPVSTYNPDGKSRFLLVADPRWKLDPARARATRSD